MKRNLLFAGVLLTLAINNAHAQFLEDGTYKYENEGMYLEIKICDEGSSVCSLSISDGPDEIVSDGKGTWFAVNQNGVGENYNGPTGWYQVPSKESTFEISSLGNDSISLTGYGTSEIKMSRLKQATTISFVGEFKDVICTDAACPCGACNYIFQDPLGQEMKFQQYDESTGGITLIMYNDEELPMANSELTGKMFSITYEKVECSCPDPENPDALVTTEELKIVSIQAQ